MIKCGNRARVRIQQHLPPFEQYCAIAKPGNRVHVVADEDDRFSPAPELLKSAEGFELKTGIADGKGLIHDEKIGIGGGHGTEGEACLHSRRIGLERLVDDVAQFAKIDDLVNPPIDLGSRHAETEPAQIDVFAAAEIGVKPGPKLEDGADAAGDFNFSAARGQRAGQDLEQSALAGPIPTDQSEHLAAAKLERDVSQRPEFLWPDPPREQTRKDILRLVVDREYLRQAVRSHHHRVDRVDRVGVHRTSPKLGRRTRNSRKPRDRNARFRIVKTSQAHGCKTRP